MTTPSPSSRDDLTPEKRAAGDQRLFRHLFGVPEHDPPAPDPAATDEGKSPFTAEERSAIIRNVFDERRAAQFWSMELASSHENPFAAALSAEGQPVDICVYAERGSAPMKGTLKWVDPSANGVNIAAALSQKPADQQTQSSTKRHIRSSLGITLNASSGDLTDDDDNDESLPPSATRKPLEEQVEFELNVAVPEGRKITAVSVFDWGVIASMPATNASGVWPLLTGRVARHEAKPVRLEGKSVPGPTGLNILSARSAEASASVLSATSDELSWAMSSDGILKISSRRSQEFVAVTVRYETKTGIECDRAVIPLAEDCTGQYPLRIPIAPISDLVTISVDSLQATDLKRLMTHQRRALLENLPEEVLVSDPGAPNVARLTGDAETCGMVAFDSAAVAILRVSTEKGGA